MAFDCFQSTNFTGKGLKLRTTRICALHASSSENRGQIVARRGAQLDLMINFILRTDRRPHQSTHPTASCLIVPSPYVSSTDVRFRIALQSLSTISTNFLYPRFIRRYEFVFVNERAKETKFYLI